MLCEIVCAIVSATLLAACWVPCCLVIWGCAEPQVSMKTVQIPFYYISAKAKETTEPPPPPPPPPPPSPPQPAPPPQPPSPTPMSTPPTMGSTDCTESYEDFPDECIPVRQHFRRRTRSDVPPGKDMTSLFRPWTEVFEVDRAKECSGELDGKRTDGPLQQDSTVSTTVSIDASLKPEEANSREVRYKSVKEHMRKRSEKYLQKKLRRKAEVPCPGLPEFLPLQIASPCCPIPPVPTAPESAFGSFYQVPKTSDWCNDLKNSPELFETAFAHGLPPSLVEEYARLLTEQQRHASERNRKQRPKKFRCPHCQVGFSNNGQLKGHIRIHTGERPFKCDAESCGKSFTRNEELTRHRRIHSGLRPFPCPECGKRFGRKDHLKKHVKTHFQQRYQLVPILPGHYPYLYNF